MSKNIFIKFYEFLKRIFIKPKLIEEHSIVRDAVIEKSNREKMKEELSVDGIEVLNEKMYKNIEDEKKMSEIIEIIETKPSLLNTLNISQLKKIKEFYEQKNEELNVKIGKLKRSNT